MKMQLKLSNLTMKIYKLNWLWLKFIMLGIKSTLKFIKNRIDQTNPSLKIIYFPF